MPYDLMAARHVQSLLYCCSKTDHSSITFYQYWLLITSAQGELTVAAGVICMEVNMYHWLKTMEL